MKKLTSVLLSVLLALSLVACGQQSAERVEVEEPAKNQATPKVDDKEGEGAADTIKIGMYVTMTGKAAGTGIAAQRGYEMALGRINAAGGINGRKLEFISYDDMGTTEAATKAATRLIEDDGVQAIVGSHMSANVAAVAPLAEKAKVLHIGIGTGATWTNVGLDYTYRATCNANFLESSIIETVVEMGAKSIALICAETEYGQSGRENILKHAETAGLEVKSDLGYQAADTDYTGIINKTLAADADAIILYSIAQEAALQIKQFRQNGYDGLLYTMEGGATTEMFTVAGSASNGVIFVAGNILPATPEEGPTEKYVDVLTEYYATYGEMPSSSCFYRAFDGMMLLAEALKNCEDINSGESIMEAFRSLSGIEMISGTFDFTDGSGDGIKSSGKYMIVDGTTKVFDPAVMANFGN